MCLLTHKCSAITGVIMLIAFLAAIVGTFGSQYSVSNLSIVLDDGVTVAELDRWVYLYAHQRRIDDGDRTMTYYSRGDFTCTSLYDKYSAALSLGVVSIVTTLAAMLFAFFRACCPVLPKCLIGLLCLLSLVLSVIVFAISISTFAQDQCDQPSYNNQGYSVDWGLIISIISAGLSLFATIFGCIF